ncbi:MAG: Gldg family protein [Planctomycetaceae bacterium]|nr:Gldg family protein [Planctomycetaceae bacterium]
MILSALIRLLLLDIVSLGVLLGIILLMARQRPVAYAVLKRNFYGYFANPTGYVFLCLFVLLTSMAAFWPYEFFNSNLGTLSQLNKWFTYIMLFFIPAITMSIWADERRQGTDELLLTLPATDFDIVIGKYTAAAAIYTVSLLFSQLSTFVVLAALTLGEVDTGLFFCNYLGYWLIGLAMIAIGMVASFLTNNLTVGFILGALFNAPLAFAASSDAVFSRDVSREIKAFSLSERFDDFGRGVISLSGLGFFVLLTTLGLYLCMILIGKRHWSSGKNGNEKLAHYILRALCLVGIVIFGSVLFRNKDRRYDATELKVSSLSDVTSGLIRGMGKERDVVVDAYISSDVPEMYAKTKYELISLLKEFESTAKGAGVPMQVRIYDSISPSSEEEKQAEQQYGITPQIVRVRERGAIADQPIMLGAAFRSGLQKVVIPFFEPGIPVEYELARSLTTVAKPARKKLGILKTEAKMMGGVDMRSFQQMPQEPIVEELGKEFELIDVNPASPIDVDRLDALLAVQPSSLAPEEMNNFIAAVKAGVPTAIFEDPQSAINPTIPGTGDPRPPMGGGMFGGGGPQPKGAIQPLWDLLEIDVPGQPSPMGFVAPDLAWQQYNPYPILESMQQSNDLWIFIREEAPGGKDAFNQESEITKGLKELMFLFAGTLKQKNGAKNQFTPLVSTGDFAGTMPLADLRGMQRSSLDRSTEIRNRRGRTVGQQTIAALIESTKPADSGAEDNATPTKPLKVVYVSDLDCMSGVFVDIRKNPSQLESVEFQFQNITFVLNVIDVLCGENKYPAIRRHVPTYSTLKLVEARADEQKREEAELQRTANENYNTKKSELEEDSNKAKRQFKEAVDKLQREGAIDASKQQELIQRLTEYQMKEAQLARKLEVEDEKLKRERDRNIREARRNTDDAIRKTQNLYKTLAVFIPAIPPLIVGVVVWVSRRLREREGISKTRLR